MCKILRYVLFLFIFLATNCQAQSIPSKEKFRQYLRHTHDFAWQHLDEANKSKFQLMNLTDTFSANVLQALNQYQSIILTLTNHPDLILSFSDYTLIRQFKLFLAIKKISHASNCPICLDFLYGMFFSSLGENLDPYPSNEYAKHIFEQLLTTNPLIAPKHLLLSPSNKVPPKELLTSIFKLFSMRFIFLSSTPGLPPYGLQIFTEAQKNVLCDTYMKSIETFFDRTEPTIRNAYMKSIGTLFGRTNPTIRESDTKINYICTKFQADKFVFGKTTFRQLFEARVADLTYGLTDLRFDIILD